MDVDVRAVKSREALLHNLLTRLFELFDVTPKPGAHVAAFKTSLTHAMTLHDAWAAALIHEQLFRHNSHGGCPAGDV